MKTEFIDVSLIYLSISDMMRILGLNNDYTIRKDIKNGLLNAKKIGVRYLIHHEDALNYKIRFNQARKKLKNYLTVKKLAATWQVSSKYILAAIKAKKLQAEKQGRSYLVAPEEVNRFFMNNQSTNQLRVNEWNQKRILS